MQHDGTIEQLSAYLDGELTDSEVAELEHRLARDPGLQSELDELRAAIDLLRTHGPVQAPAALYGDILRAVEDEPMPGGLWAWLQRPFGLPLPTLALAAVGLLVVGVAITGTVVVNAPGALRPAVTGLDSWTSSSGSRSDSKEALAKNDEADTPRGQAVDPSAGGGSEASGSRPPDPVDGQDAVADLGELTTGSGAADAEESQPELASDTNKASPSRLGIDRGSADDGGELAKSVDNVTRSTTGSADSAMYSGHSLTSVALRADDLEKVAALYQKHAGANGRTAKVAERIASMQAGTRDFVIDLPDEQSRNAFEADLARLFRGRINSTVSKDQAFTVGSARMTLRLTVSPLAPATGGTKDTPPIQTLRKGKDAYEADDRVEQPAGTTTKE